MVVAVRRAVRFVAMWVLAASELAMAQVAEQAPPEVPPRDSRNELAPGVWPRVSLEDLRGMRECALEDPPAVIGSPMPCRPPVLPSRVHMSFAAAWVTGLAQHGGDVLGVNAGALDATYWLTRSLGLGARYQIGVVATPTPMLESPRAGIVGEALGMLHVRAFTDEVDRDAFTFSLGGCYATRDARLGGNGPLARFAIARDIGYIIYERSSVTWAWELAAEQAFGASQLRSLTASVRAGFELGIREPKNLDTVDPDPPFRFAIGGEARASTHLGLGASFTLSLFSRLSWRTTAFWTTGHDDEGLHGLRATWALVTGPRLMITRGTIAPYLDVQAGPAAIGGDPSATFGVLAEAEGGFEFHLGCQTRVDFGGRAQTRVDNGLSLRTGFFILRIEHGRALRHEQGSCAKDLPIAH